MQAKADQDTVAFFFSPCCEYQLIICYGLKKNDTKHKLEQVGQEASYALIMSPKLNWF